MGYFAESYLSTHDILHLVHEMNADSMGSGSCAMCADVYGLSLTSCFHISSFPRELQPQPERVLHRSFVCDQWPSNTMGRRCHDGFDLLHQVFSSEKPIQPRHHALRILRYMKAIVLLDGEVE